MTSKDLQGFLEKVKDLNSLVESLEKVKGRKEKLSSCKTHNEVVHLARSWGYEIGRQWGEYK